MPSSSQEPDDRCSDARARRAAKRIGLWARKSRWRRGTTDNHGGFQLIDPYRNSIVAGEKFNLTAEAIVEYCAGDGYRGSTGLRR
jgi:hypothetical protein